MTALDAFAVLAFLRDEPAAAEVEQLLRTPTVLAAVNAAEIVDQLVRVYGHDPDDVHADLALLSRSGMEIPASTSGTARASRPDASGLLTTTGEGARSPWLTALLLRRPSTWNCPWPRQTRRWPPWCGTRPGRPPVAEQPRRESVSPLDVGEAG